MTTLPPSVPVLEIVDVEKRYQALRPLRLQALRIAHAERVAILGLDAGAAEVLVNLVTGAGVADRGIVRVEGRNNAEIASGDEWLASLDRFGIVSARAVLLDGATLEQNLAMPFTLRVDPLAPAMAERVAVLARACGLIGSMEDAEQGRVALRRLAGEIPPEMRARAHLARAVALDPALLVLEHPTLGVPEPAQAAYAADIVRVADARHMAALVLTQDQAFAQLVAHRTLKLNPATGALTPVKRGWFR
jgi:ABC-type transporter Mla maintaining outer membrane lipid asymmetry ATPase subunit MlaF